MEPTTSRGKVPSSTWRVAPSGRVRVNISDIKYSVPQMAFNLLVRKLSFEDTLRHRLHTCLHSDIAMKNPTPRVRYTLRSELWQDSPPVLSSHSSTVESPDSPPRSATVSGRSGQTVTSRIFISMPM